MSSPRYSDKDKAEILRRYAAGEASAIISDAFGCHASYPGLLAKRRGLPLRHSDRCRRKMAEAAKKRGRS